MNFKNASGHVEIILDNQFNLVSVEQENYPGEITSSLLIRLIEDLLLCINDYEKNFIINSNDINVVSNNEILTIVFSNTSSFGTTLKSEFIRGNYSRFYWV